MRTLKILQKTLLITAAVSLAPPTTTCYAHYLGQYSSGHESVGRYGESRSERKVRGTDDLGCKIKSTLEGSTLSCGHLDTITIKPDPECRTSIVGDGSDIRCATDKLLRVTWPDARGHQRTSTVNSAACTDPSSCGMTPTWSALGNNKYQCCQGWPPLD